MSIFKKERNEKNDQKAIETTNAQVSIKILGSGCSACRKLEKHTAEALGSMSINAKVDYVTDLSQIASYGAMSMPALIINEKLVSQGTVLKSKQVEDIIKKQL